MLLFQWGTYDFGDGPTFRYDITRQLIDEADPDDDGAIWQLSVTTHYAEALGASLGSGNRWCHSPNELPPFTTFIGQCPATKAVSSQRPVRVEVRYGQAG